jgi:hypothetical protein
MRWLATLSMAAVASLSAWFVAGGVLDERARVDAADRWADAELCLLGPGLGSGERPSARMRSIALAEEASATWPNRCVGELQALDRALAAPPLRAAFAGVPRLTPLLGSPSPARESGVDAVWDALRRAGLPAGRPTYRGTLPAVASARLDADALPEIPGVRGLAEVRAEELTRDGEVRLRLEGERPRACRLDLAGDGSAPALGCRTRPSILDDESRLAWSDGDGPELALVDVESGAALVDVASGARLWTLPGRQGGAVVGASGEVIVLQAEHDATNGDRKHWRLVRLAPGRSGEDRRTDIPADATAIAWPTGVAWWPAGEGKVPVYFARFDGTRLAERFTIGSAVAPYRLLSRCSSRGTHALVAEAAGSPFALVGTGSSIRVEPLSSGARTACFDGALHVTAVVGDSFEQIRCDRSSCRRRTTALPRGDSIVAAAVGDSLALAWLDRAGALRAAFDEGDGRLRGELLLLEGRRAGFEVRRLEAFGGPRAMLLILEDSAGRVRAMRLDRRGVARPVSVGAW